MAKLKLRQVPVIGFVVEVAVALVTKLSVLNALEQLDQLPEHAVGVLLIVTGVTQASPLTTFPCGHPQVVAWSISCRLGLQYFGLFVEQAPVRVPSVQVGSSMQVPSLHIIPFPHEIKSYL